MNIWFVCYLLGCVDIVAWFLIARNASGWRVPVLFLAGIVSGLFIAVVLPWFALVYLDFLGTISASVVAARMG